MRVGALALAFYLLAFALVVAHGVEDAPQGAEESVVMLGEDEGAASISIPLPSPPMSKKVMEDAMSAAMKTIPKSVLALAMGKKPAAKQTTRLPLVKAPMTKKAIAPMAKTKPKVMPPIVHSSFKAVAKTPMPTFEFSSKPQIAPITLKEKESPAMAALAKLVRAHNIQIPTPPEQSAPAGKVEAAKVEAAKVELGAAQSKTQVPLAARNLKAAVNAEKAHTLKQKSGLHKNALGEIDGSRNTWQAFKDPVPKEALNHKRTFLPITQKAFAAPKHISKVLAPVDAILKHVQQAEARAAVKSSETNTELKESIGHIMQDAPVDYKTDDTVLQPAKGLSKQESETWPFGRPQEEISLLQESDEDDEHRNARHKKTYRRNHRRHSRRHARRHARHHIRHKVAHRSDLGESFDEEQAERHNVSPVHSQGTQFRVGDEGPPLLNYDPVQDMLQANGWSRAVLRKPRQEVNECIDCSFDKPPC